MMDVKLPGKSLLLEVTAVGSYQSLLLEVDASVGTSDYVETVQNQGSRTASEVKKTRQLHLVARFHVSFHLNCVVTNQGTRRQLFYSIYIKEGK